MTIGPLGLIRFALLARKERHTDCSPFQQQERNWFISQLQEFAKVKHIRVSFLSGDVHCSAVGVFKSLKDKNNPEVPSPMDYRYMLNVVTSKFDVL